MVKNKNAYFIFGIIVLVALFYFLPKLNLFAVVSPTDEVVFRRCTIGNALGTYGCVGTATTCQPKPTISLDVDGDGVLENYNYAYPSTLSFTRKLNFQTPEGYDIYAYTNIENSKLFNIVIDYGGSYVSMSRGGNCSTSTTPEETQKPNSREVYISGTCVPQTCASLGKTCGYWDNGCSGQLNCGVCEENDGLCTWNEPANSNDCKGNIKVYLPANLQKDSLLYISSDGSTYYNSALTQLAAGPDSNRLPLRAKEIKAINLLNLSKTDYGFRCLSFQMWASLGSTISQLAHSQLGNSGSSEFTSDVVLSSDGNLAFKIYQGANSACSVSPQIIAGDYIMIKTNSASTPQTNVNINSITSTKDNLNVVYQVSWSGGVSPYIVEIENDGTGNKYVENIQTTSGNFPFTFSSYGSKSSTICVYDSSSQTDNDCQDYNVILTNSSTSTCADGIKNGAETGIDCGGSCAACSVEDTISSFWEDYKIGIIIAGVVLLLLLIKGRKR